VTVVGKVFRTTLVPVAPLRCVGLRISPQGPTSSKLRLERCATRSVKTSPFCDLARLPSKGAFHQLASCDACRALSGETQSRELARLRRFCRRRAVHYATSPLRFRAAFANVVVSARPPCTPAYLIDAGASLGRTQPLDFCNEFSKYDTRARTPRALSSPDAGVVPAFVATHDALFTLLDSSSFGCKEDSSSMRRSELRVFPDVWPREPNPEAPRGFAPTNDTDQVGSQGMGNAQAERAEQR